MSIIKLRHKYGYFGTSDVSGDVNDTPHYLEFVELPFSLLSKNLDGTVRIDLTNANGLDLERVFTTINAGEWVIFE